MCILLFQLSATHMKHISQHEWLKTIWREGTQKVNFFRVVSEFQKRGITFLQSSFSALSLWHLNQEKWARNTVQQFCLFQVHTLHFHNVHVMTEFVFTLPAVATNWSWPKTSNNPFRWRSSPCYLCKKTKDLHKMFCMADEINRSIRVKSSLYTHSVV